MGGGWKSTLRHADADRRPTPSDEARMEPRPSTRAVPEPLDYHGPMERRLGLLGAVCLGVTWAAVSCGDNLSGPGSDGRLDGSTQGDGGPAGGLAALRIEPPSVSLRTDGLTPATQAFSVIGVLADGRETDLTQTAALSLRDPSLGHLAGATFTSRLFGGSTELVAEAQGRTATANIRVVLERELALPPGPNQNPLPVDAVTRLEDAPDNPGRAPQLVYPNDGVLLPPNLTHVEFHFRRGHADNSIFELSFTSPTSRVAILARCQRLRAGCVVEPPDAVWAALAETHRGTGRLEVRVRASDAALSYRSDSNPIHIEFSASPVQGGLYYWSTSRTAIMRVDFNAPDPTPELFFPFQGSGCYGCHALSPNGRKMTVSRAGQNQAQLSLVDVATRSTVFRDDGNRREQFQSWDPSSRMFAAIYGDNNAPSHYVRTAIRIRDGESGDILDSIDVGDEPTHPDWSPAGDRIIFSRSTMPETTNQRPGRCGISYIEKNASGGWTGPHHLIAPEDGFNRYYPAFSPDGRFVVFNESVCAPGVTYNSACDGDADDVAKLWAMDKDATRPRFLLDRANAPGLEDDGKTDLANTYPRWAPFVDHRHRDGTGRVMWMTFSSRRQYGLRSPAGSGQLLWMVAIDPERILAGQDGSHPAFALPFQDLETSNHIAQWASVIVPPVPDTDGGVPGSDGGPDPGGGGRDAGQCLSAGDPCDPSANACCAGLQCSDQGGGVFRCRFDL